MMSQTCYYLKDPSEAALATTYVPNEICLESVIIDEAKNTISVYSFFPQFSELFKNLQLNYFARKNEDGFRFKSSGNLVTEAEIGIYETVTSDLLISGIVDNYGAVDVRDLNIQSKKL
jgi:hypothetical protein